MRDDSMCTFHYGILVGNLFEWESVRGAWRVQEGKQKKLGVVQLGVDV